MRYHDDPAATSLSTPVLSCTAVEGGFDLLLGDTVLFPEGGGQPDDHGTVDGLRVTALRKVPGGVLHRVSARLAGQVRVELDVARRLDLTQQHSGQHLLSALAQDRFGLPTTAFHLGEERADIEVDGLVDDAVLAALEAAVNTAIREDRPVRTRLVAASELAALPVRTRGLPDGFEGPVRLVEIEGLDLNTCGGTHVSRTGALQSFSFVAVERLKRATRLHFWVGGRVQAGLAALLERQARLTKLLSTGPADHAAAVERLAEDAKRDGKALQAVRRELATAIGAGLVPTGPTLVWSRADADPPFLSAVADAVLARHDVICVFAGGEREGCFLVAGPPDRVAELGPRVAARLEGRGGGARGRFQGKAARVDHLGDCTFA
jgi:misacylated tRNA(Ala) deacylase